MKAAGRLFRESWIRKRVGKVGKVVVEAKKVLMMDIQVVGNPSPFIRNDAAFSSMTAR